MEIPKQIGHIIEKLYSNKLLGEKEIGKVEFWLNSVQYNPETEAWLKTVWNESHNDDVAISFGDIRRRIKEGNKRTKKLKMRTWMLLVQKAAAVLLLPLLALSTWLLFFHHDLPDQWMSLFTKQKERTHIVLPDGSEVWLNVDTKLEYPARFCMGNRNLKLEGEAYFKVSSNKKSPFIVQIKDFKVKAVGTEFNISAYGDNYFANTSLNKGLVEFTYSPEHKTAHTFSMMPGEKAIVDRENESVKLIKTDGTKSSGSWRNGELNFENEPMTEVFRKMERWYGIKIHFSPKDFMGETLFVNLKGEESVDKLLLIINKAIGIKIKKENNEYWIMKEQKK